MREPTSWRVMLMDVSSLMTVATSFKAAAKTAQATALAAMQLALDSSLVNVRTK
jgi:hypothetical protein